MRVDVLLHGEPVDAFSTIVHREKAYAYGKQMTERLKRADPAAAVRRGDPGGDRLEDHRARDREGQAQGRARQVLRRRHHPQAQAARDAEEGQGAHAPRRHASTCRRRRSSPRCAWTTEGGREEVRRASGRHLRPRAVLPHALRLLRLQRVRGARPARSRDTSARCWPRPRSPRRRWDGRRRSRACSSGGGTPTTLDARGSAGAARAPARRRSRVAPTPRSRSRPTPTRSTSASARGRCCEAGFDAAVDGRAVVRPARCSRRSSGCTRPTASARAIARRARGRLRQREPRPDLRRGRRDARVVGAHAARDDRARARARQRVRPDDRAGDAARPQGRARRRARARSRPAGRHVRSSRASCCAMPATGHYEVSNWAQAGVRVPPQPRVLGAPAVPRARAPARTRTATTGAGGTSARPRSTWRRVERGELPIGGEERLEPSDAYLEEVFLRLRILEGVPSSWVDDEVAGAVPRERSARRRRRRARPDRTRHAPAERARPGPDRGSESNPRSLETDRHGTSAVSSGDTLCCAG